MISNLSKKITLALVKGDQIDEGERELYEYGVFILISNIFFFSVTLIVGLILGIAAQSAVYYLAFMALRRYAGGYHAKTELRCRLISTLSIIVSLTLIKLTENIDTALAFLIAASIGSAIIIAIAPIDTAEKPLDETEYKHYRIVTLVLLLCLDAVFAVSVVLNKNVIYSPISVAIALESILALAGKIHRWRESRLGG